jgi:hypothetical protein
MNYTFATKITRRVEHFYTNRCVPKFGLDIYYWGAGLAVTGRMNT